MASPRNRERNDMYPNLQNQIDNSGGIDINMKQLQLNVLDQMGQQKQPPDNSVVDYDEEDDVNISELKKIQEVLDVQKAQLVKGGGPQINDDNFGGGDISSIVIDPMGQD